MGNLLEEYTKLSRVGPIYEYYYLLDELGPLLDRCDELEIFMEAPSTSSGEWKDAEVELMAVVDRINLLCNYLPSSPL